MKYLDIGSIFVIIITFALFVLALFVKGFTHDLLLEAGIFLVSIKLMIMAFQTNRSFKKIELELKEIKEFCKQNEVT